MRPRSLVIAILLIIATLAKGDPARSDTSGNAQPEKYSLKATVRLHSMGFFSYGGRLVSQNHVIDLNVVYKRRTWGFQFIKAQDLNDTHTPINFALAMVNKPFSLGNRITITPSVGVVLEQFESIADHGSDAAVLLTVAYRIHPHVTLEHTALLANLVLAPDHRDWVNRLRVLYSKGHLDLTFFGWHNNQVFDTGEYAALGVSIFMNRLPLAGPLELQTGITGVCMVSDSNEQTTDRINGLFLTLGVSVN